MNSFLIKIQSATMTMLAELAKYEQLPDEEIGEDSNYELSLKETLIEYAYFCLESILKFAAFIAFGLMIILITLLFQQLNTLVHEVTHLTVTNNHCPNTTHVPAAPATYTKTLAAAPYTWQGCGHSAPEARANNCRFDLMFSAWLPDFCFDVGLHEQFLVAGNYSWFRDASFADEISEAEVRRGEHVYVYTRAEFHFAHCGYAWLMQARDYPGSVAIDNTIYDWEHTTHCTKMLIDHKLPRNVTRTKVGFAKCGLPAWQ